MTLSWLVALIFTPALCATLLKPPEKGHHEKRGFFGWFNRHFDRGNRTYERGVVRAVNHTRRYLIVFVVIIGLMALLFTQHSEVVSTRRGSGHPVCAGHYAPARPRSAPRKRWRK